MRALEVVAELRAWITWIRGIGGRLIREESALELAEWSMVALVFALGACAISMSIETRMERALIEIPRASR